MKKKQVVIMMTVLVIGWSLLLLILLQSSSQKEAYNIKHPAEGKHHAIVQITPVNKSGGYSCTAFVIDDTRAVTAGHCVKITKSFIDYKYKKLMKQSDKIVREYRKKLENLKDCFTSRCNHMFNYISGLLNEELSARKKAVNLKVDVFNVKNIYGEDTKVKATALFKRYGYRDHAVLTGNFKNFEKLNIAYGFDVKEGDILRSCGYAGIKIPPVCIDFEAKGSFNFLYYGKGLMIKGMSGGPVINSKGEVVGINSGVKKTFIYMDTLVGVFNRRFKKPKKKIKPPKKRTEYK